MIQSLRLQNFRSYKDESFEFEPGVNIIVGSNGSGKTNLLEAILVSLTGQSYRASDQELVLFEKPWARLDMQVAGQGRIIKLEKTDLKTQKTYEIDEKKYKILNMDKTLPVVLFEPNHLALLHGQPELRRGYLDSILEQTVPGYKTTRRHYKRVLSQRNSLLKQTRQLSNEQLFVWNLRLSELGGSIARSRNELVSEIADNINKLYQEVSGTKGMIVNVEYISKLPISSYETALIKGLEASLEYDIRRGYTSFGPHRDDMLVTFNGRPAEEVASRGETRTTLLALKVNELYILEKIRGQKPTLLLDDVFSELDGRRRHSLAGFLKDYQTFITTTDADLVLKEQMEGSNTIPISTN